MEHFVLWYHFNRLCWNIFYINIILLPSWNIFYFDRILLPRWNILYFNVILLLWYHHKLEVQLQEKVVASLHHACSKVDGSNSASDIF